jgi:glycosyltransferase involved in cell wall biosynthesis
MENFTRLSIIVPAFNEASSIRKTLDRIAEVRLINGIQKEIILVNDCSTDSTEQIVQEYIRDHPEQLIQFLHHEVNRGKGAAIQTAIAKAAGEYLVIQDADLEYDPEELNVLLKPVIRGLADVVYGSRFVGGRSHRILFFWHSIGNKFLTTLNNMFTNLNLTDMESGYKLFKTALIRQVRLREKRFGFEPEITAKIARIPDIRIYEVGISYYGRTYKEGKKIKWKDGLWAIYCIVKYNLFDRKSGPV